jgi:protein phosphatase
LARLVSKTFCRDLGARFPSEEASREDTTGFTELIRTLDVCRRTLDNVHLEIAAWATTGMVRSGNEDAFALVHAMDAQQDDLGEYALVLLADGMGGSEAGEVAAALAVQTLREHLLRQPLFAALAGEPATTQTAFDLEACKRVLGEALHEANSRVYRAAQTPGVGKRGMGCTAEAVYVDGRCVVVGHVGDSRTYHLHQGVLTQLTRDQTLVARLVELGQLTPEEALTHPRRSELQQALGGQFTIVPDFAHALLQPGDWVVVCSDGLSNHVPPDTLKEMLQTAASAEMAARRLVNLVNFGGATDNATVVVVRAT